MESAAPALAAATATVASRGQSAGLAGKAVGVLVSQLETQFAAGNLCVVYLVLGDAAWLIFNLHIQFVRRNHFGGQVEDLGELFRRKPMIGIIAGHPGLEEAGFKPANLASTINEVLHDMPDLSEVEIRRDLVTVWQDETDIQVCVLPEVFLEDPHVHAIIGIFRYRYTQT
jgi:hypothetical protein